MRKERSSNLLATISSMAMLAMCLLLFVVDHSEARRSLTGCAAFGHSCFGAHGKRALPIAAGDVDMIQEQDQQDDDLSTETLQDSSQKITDEQVQEERPGHQLVLSNNPLESFQMVAPDLESKDSYELWKEIQQLSYPSMGIPKTVPSSVTPFVRIGQLAAMMSTNNAMPLVDVDSGSYLPARKGFYDYLASKVAAERPAHVQPDFSNNFERMSPNVEDFVGEHQFQQHLPRFYRQLKRTLATVGKGEDQMLVLDPRQYEADGVSIEQNSRLARLASGMETAEDLQP